MIAINSVECVWAGRAQLGEGPLWCPERGAQGQLLFVDILGGRLHAFDLASGRTQGWTLDEPCCWLAVRDDGDGFIAGLRSRLVHLRLTDAGPSVVGPWTTPEEPAGNRFNDAKVDPRGRLWFGSMDDAAERSSGAFYRLAGEAIDRVDEGYRVANGPAISPDGATLYHSDTPRGIIYAFDVSAEGELANKREHIRFAETQGRPDGMTCDAEGGLWVAHWGGGRVSRFRADGELDETLPVPASRVTSCAFGGAGLDQLYITTAAVDRDDETAAGGLFRVVPGVRGLPAGRFAVRGSER
ncbi:SMP-30/gluconolactonase/LRE family protein [Halomonas sp. HP20-15]|uniref:SMP-30/gluconolactonase/LRE family protein n=1 Tax=Halomonas sp. HP20-15 TaxID=3085901 RepID=UPI002980FFC3|nr:SMP-30/gluconolactonase/LRE family protein [Halomonas sp. HP20-15]MDW5378341.1 SMP-30/gluconolactonase/LRE family protein [Halomonas sp. HP20-15]